MGGLETAAEGEEVSLHFESFLHENGSDDRTLFPPGLRSAADSRQQPADGKEKESLYKC